MKMKALLLLAAMLLFSMAPAFATRTQITTQVPVSIYSQPAALAAALNFSAADNTNGNYCILTGREVVIAYNSDTVAQTITVSSAPDVLGRTLDITAYSLPTLTYAVLGPFPLPGWGQSGSPRTLNFTASAATVKYAIISLPPSW